MSPRWLSMAVHLGGAPSLTQWYHLWNSMNMPWSPRQGWEFLGGGRHWLFCQGQAIWWYLYSHLPLAAKASGYWEEANILPGQNLSWGQNAKRFQESWEVRLLITSVSPNWYKIRKSPDSSAFFHGLVFCREGLCVAWQTLGSSQGEGKTCAHSSSGRSPYPVNQVWLHSQDDASIWVSLFFCSTRERRRTCLKIKSTCEVKKTRNLLRPCSWKNSFS